MYRLTPLRKSQAQDVLDRYTKYLHDARVFECRALERELGDLWGLGYQTLKDIMIDVVSNHTEYVHLAAYYMEHSGRMGSQGVVSEFQTPLAKLFGLSSWDYDTAKEERRKQFWENAFALITHFDVEAPSDDRAILLVGSEVCARLIQYFLDHPAALRELSPRRFEELIAELFDGFGYDVELTASTRDNGRDVIAIGNRNIATSKFLIECRRHSESNKVDVGIVRSLHGVVTDERATKGIIATTSTFTRPAIEFMERNKWILEGRDFNGVLDWLKEYQRLKGVIVATSNGNRNSSTR